MLLSRKYFLLRENYTTMCFKPMIRIRTPVKQYAHTVSSEIRTPVKRNLQAMKEYMASKDKNVSLLVEYAVKLDIRDKVMMYVEVLV